MSKLDIWKFDFDFQIPETIFEYDKKYLFFQKNMIKLQYVLYTLKISHKKIVLQTKDTVNTYTDFAFKRWELTQSSLETNILYYEKLYNSFLEKIHFR
jgi:hypothetical protein